MLALFIELRELRVHSGSATLLTGGDDAVRSKLQNCQPSAVPTSLQTQKTAHIGVLILGELHKHCD